MNKKNPFKPWCSTLKSIQKERNLFRNNACMIKKPNWNIRQRGTFGKKLKISPSPFTKNKEEKWFRDVDWIDFSWEKPTIRLYGARHDSVSESTANSQKNTSEVASSAVAKTVGKEQNWFLVKLKFSQEIWNCTRNKNNKFPTRNNRCCWIRQNKS